MDDEKKKSVSSLYRLPPECIRLIVSFLIVSTDTEEEEGGNNRNDNFRVAGVLTMLNDVDGGDAARNRIFPLHPSFASFYAYSTTIGALRLSCDLLGAAVDSTVDAAAIDAFAAAHPYRHAAVIRKGLRAWWAAAMGDGDRQWAHQRTEGAEVEGDCGSAGLPLQEEADDVVAKAVVMQHRWRREAAAASRALFDPLYDSFLTEEDGEGAEGLRWTPATRHFYLYTNPKSTCSAKQSVSSSPGGFFSRLASSVMSAVGGGSGSKRNKKGTTLIREVRVIIDGPSSRPIIIAPPEPPWPASACGLLRRGLGIDLRGQPAEGGWSRTPIAGRPPSELLVTKTADLSSSSELRWGKAALPVACRDCGDDRRWVDTACNGGGNTMVTLSKGEEEGEGGTPSSHMNSASEGSSAASYFWGSEQVSERDEEVDAQEGGRNAFAMGPVDARLLFLRCVAAASEVEPPASKESQMSSPLRQWSLLGRVHCQNSVFGRPLPSEEGGGAASSAPPPHLARVSAEALIVSSSGFASSSPPPLLHVSAVLFEERGWGDPSPLYRSGGLWAADDSSARSSSSASAASSSGNRPLPVGGIVFVLPPVTLYEALLRRVCGVRHLCGTEGSDRQQTQSGGSNGSGGSSSAVGSMWWRKALVEVLRDPLLRHFSSTTQHKTDGMLAPGVGCGRRGCCTAAGDTDTKPTRVGSAGVERRSGYTSNVCVCRAEASFRVVVAVPLPTGAPPRMCRLRTAAHREELPQPDGGDRTAAAAAHHECTLRDGGGADKCACGVTLADWSPAALDALRAEVAEAVHTVSSALTRGGNDDDAKAKRKKGGMNIEVTVRGFSERSRQSIVEILKAAAGDV